MLLSNNLLVGLRHIVEVGDSGPDSNARTVNATLDHNTIIHCLDPFSIHWESALDSRNNLHCYVLGTWYVRAWDEYLKKGGNVHDVIRYRGTRNLYHETRWEEFVGFPFSGFSGFQRLTRNGETQAIFANPRFVNPQLVIQAKDRILPPSAFALRADSPANAAATDGTDIGCDLSKIPTPPAMVEKQVERILRSK